MILPRWSTIGLVVALVTRFALAWLHTKKSGRAVEKRFYRPLWRQEQSRSSLLANFLAAAPCGSMLLYLKEAWRLEGKGDR